MQIEAIATHRIESGESLEKIIDQYCSEYITENNIIVITSKIISICENSCIDKTKISKYELIKQEADLILDTDHNPYNFIVTIKNGILIPSAGIDESNGDNVYILYPKDIQKTACAIWEYLRTKYAIKNLGIVITDSHTTPMRMGVTGIALGWCGFEPLYSYVNKPDLYGNPLRVTQVNILDSLATAAVFVMGEGNEQTPIAIINHAPKISFLDRNPTLTEQQSVIVSLEEDLYAPLFKEAKWLKN